MSKVKAHQITCNFLSQSKEKSTGNPNEASNGQEGFFGIGISYQVLKNQVCLTNIKPGFPADIAGLQLFDEIVKINDKAFSNECLTVSLISQMIKGENDAPVTLTIKRFGQDKVFNIKVDRAFIPYAINSETGEENKNETVTNNEVKTQLNTNQQQKQTFLKKMVTAIQKDSVIMKNIETAKKVNYALAILNKWTNEPLGKNFFTQIDEQLGMVSSLVNIIKGNNPNFSFDAMEKYLLVIMN